MPEAVMAPEFGVWEAPGHSVRIEYSEAVMQQIRMEAVEGFHRVPHGGVETGGILFGTHQGDLVRILAYRPIACEYAMGPSFTLSEKDRAALAEALRSSSEDAELAALEPAGWYHSHTRSEIFLSELDLEFFQRYFPQAWQVALVVRPASFTPDQSTEVEVRFEGVGDETRVSIEHRAWDTIPQKHAARHGFPEHVTLQRAADWWRASLTALKTKLS